jgi:hypothetical protein
MIPAMPQVRALAEFTADGNTSDQLVHQAIS